MSQCLNDAVWTDVTNYTLWTSQYGKLFGLVSIGKTIIFVIFESREAIFLFDFMLHSTKSESQDGIICIILCTNYNLSIILLITSHRKPCFHLGDTQKQKNRKNRVRTPEVAPREVLIVLFTTRDILCILPSLRHEQR